MQRIEATNEREYSRLVLSVEHLKILADIAASEASQERSRLQINNFVIKSREDIDDLLNHEKAYSVFASPFRQ